MGSKIPDELLAATQLGVVMSSLPIGLLAVDLNGTICLANNQAEAIFGYPQGQLIGRNISQLVPEAQRAVHDEEMREYWRNPRRRSMGMGAGLTGTKIGRE